MIERMHITYIVKMQTDKYTILILMLPNYCHFTISVGAYKNFAHSAKKMCLCACCMRHQNELVLFYNGKFWWRAIAKYASTAFVSVQRDIFREIKPHQTNKCGFAVMAHRFRWHRLHMKIILSYNRILVCFLLIFFLFSSK